MPLSLLRKGSASRRVWTSPPVPTERYELRPCLCVFVARFDRRIFLLFVKNGFVVGVPCQGNSEPPADGATTPLSQCHAWLRNAAWLGPPYTIPSAANQHCIHTRCILSCTAGGRRAARGREGERENRKWEERREQGTGGREGRRKR